MKRFVIRACAREARQEAIQGTCCSRRCAGGLLGPGSSVRRLVWVGADPCGRIRSNWWGNSPRTFLPEPNYGLSQGFAPATSLGLQLQAGFDRWLPFEGLEFVTSMIWRTGKI